MLSWYCQFSIYKESNTCFSSFCIVAARLARCVCRMFKPRNSAAGRSGEAKNEWLTSVGACPSLSEDGDEVHGHKEVVLTAGMCDSLRVIPICPSGQTPTEAQIK